MDNNDCHKLLSQFPHLLDDLVADCIDQADEAAFLKFLLGERISSNSQCSAPFSSPCVLGYYSKCYQRHTICLHDEDEYGHLTPCRNGAHLQHCLEHKCPTMFKCQLAYCIKLSRVCDGIIHCPLGEDESNCNYSSTSRTCPGLIKCKDSPVCVHPMQLCDGVNDCPVHHDDEDICDTHVCPPQCACYGQAIICLNANLTSFPAISSHAKVVLMEHNNLKVITLPFCSHMIWLGLQRNQIFHVPGATFYNCSIMFHLNLSSNNLNAINSGIFRGLVALHSLDISNNPIVSIKSGGFDGLEALPALSLSLPLLDVIENCAFEPLLMLTSLEIRDTFLHILTDNNLCQLSKLRSLTLLNNPIKYIYGDPFAHLSSLEVVNTDIHHICCLLPEQVQCKSSPRTKPFVCNGIIPFFILKTIMWLSLFFIFLLNVISVGFWMVKKGKFEWILFIISLNTSDMLMGIYLLIVVVGDLHYDASYASWSSGVWIGSWLCGLAMFLSQMAYECSLWLIMLHSIHTLLVTKYAMKRIRIKRSYILMGIAIGILVNSLISGFNVHLSFTNGSEVTTLCLFIIYSENVPSTQWVLLLYHGLLLIVLVMLQLSIVIYFKRKKHIKSTSDSKLKERRLVIRMSLSTIINIISWLVLTVIQILNMTGYYNQYGIVIYFQVIAMILNAVFSVLLNTYYNNTFIKCVNKYLEYEY